MKKLLPDLHADLVPGVTAAGFFLGESFVDVGKKIGLVEWYGPEIPVRDILLGSTSWIGVKRRVGFGDEFLLSYRYMNEVVSLYFEGSEKLYRISVGAGYHGCFSGFGVNDDLRSLEKNTVFYLMI